MKVRTWILEEDIFRDGRLVLEWWLGHRPNRWLLPGDFVVTGQLGSVVEVEIDIPDLPDLEETHTDPLEAAWAYLHARYGDRQ